MKTLHSVKQLKGCKVLALKRVVAKTEAEAIRQKARINTFQPRKRWHHWYHYSLLRRGLFVLWGFCVVGRLGRKKTRAFPSSHRPPRAFYFFDYWYFDGDTQREPLRRREDIITFRDALQRWAAGILTVSIVMISVIFSIQIREGHSSCSYLYFKILKLKKEEVTLTWRQ